MIVNPFCVAAYQTDAACGTGDTHVVVGAGPYAHRVCRIVDNGVDQDRKTCAKTGCVLGVNVMDHQSPAVFLRSLERTDRSVITNGGQEGLYRDDIAVAAILCVDGHAV